MSESLSRHFILNWLSTLRIPIPRIEDVGKGTVLCKLLTQLDSNFPKYKENPQTEHEFLNNLIIVKNYLDNKNIRLFFPIDKMCKLKMQDNLEVIQWFYKYWCKEKEMHAMAEKKDSLVENSSLSDINVEHIKEESSMEITRLSIKPRDNTSEEPAAECPDVPAEQTPLIVNESIIDIPIKDDLDSADFSKSLDESLGRRPIQESSESTEELQRQLAAKNEKIKALREFSKIFESERDFYFGKLVLIERLLLESTTFEEGMKGKILEIMYEEECNENEPAQK